MGYWNRQQTIDVLGLFATNEYLRDFKEKWMGLKNGKLTEDQKAGLEQAEEAIEKVLQSLCNSVDSGTQRKLLNSSKEYQVGLLPRDNKMFREEAEKELGADCAYVSAAALAELAELALESTCGPCVCKANQDKCKARGAFIDLEIPFFNENPPAGTCPYEIEKEYWQDEKEARLKVVEGIPTERLIALAAMEKKKQERAEIDLTDKCGSCKHFESTKGSKGICREKEKETARSRRKCQGYINGSLTL